ncbi:MAG: LysR family transcriptional regulator [Alphaproteobacteria bacterium]|nr:LysR family transcriptional regulator [Alphaproteobacteria bacterium]
MRDLNDLAYFAAVVRHRGFAAAARALNVPKSTLSRRISRLEDQLGVRLLERSTRRFRVTEVGQEYLRHCEALVAEAEAADDVAARGQSEPQGLVRIASPIGFTQVLALALPDFLRRHPKMRIQVLSSNRPVDLIGERVDIAIRVRRRLDADPTLTMRVLGHGRGLLVASPGFVARHGMPETPADLAGLPTIAHHEEPGEAIWRLYAPDGSEHMLHHVPVLSSGDFPVLMQGVLEGFGIAELPEQLVREPLRDGRLVELFPGWHTGEGTLHLVFTSRRGMLPAVRATLDFLAPLLTPTVAA